MALHTLSGNPSWHPSWIEIDLDQFRLNIQQIKKQFAPSLFCLPVKANAYGHGLCEISLAAQLAGVDYLAVAHCQEAVTLRRAGIHLPILVLGAIHQDQLDDLIDFELDVSISSGFKADFLAERCHSRGKRCRIHLEVDTGMQRTGVRCDTAKKLFGHLETLNCFDLIGVYSHMATSDASDHPFNAKQMQLFEQLLQEPPFQGKKLIRHLANSSGSLHFKGSRWDMVRPSLLSFGYAQNPLPNSLIDVKPCFSLKAKVSYFKVVDAGVGISYGHSYTTSKRTRIVTVPIGYGDGYRRCLSNRASVLINAQRFPIVGTICMDQFMVDIGEHEVHVGDEVVLIGKQGNEEITLQEISQLCETIPYEILCQFNDRLPRVYKKETFFN
jgi:alanine racemase